MALQASPAGGLGAAALSWFASGMVSFGPRTSSARNGVSTQATTSFILTGVALSAFFMAITQYLISRLNITSVSDAQLWLTGSLSMATWTRILLELIVFVVAMGVIATQTLNLKMLALGDDVALGQGVNVSGTRKILFLCAIVVATVTVAFTGPIAFVAFLAGPVTRYLLGGVNSLLAAGLFGALLVVTADFIGQNAFPAHIPVGVLTGIVGMPVLIYMVIRKQK